VSRAPFYKPVQESTQVKVYCPCTYADPVIRNVVGKLSQAQSYVFPEVFAFDINAEWKQLACTSICEMDGGTFFTGQSGFRTTDVVAYQAVDLSGGRVQLGECQEQYARVDYVGRDGDAEDSFAYVIQSFTYSATIYDKDGKILNERDPNRAPPD